MDLNLNPQINDNIIEKFNLEFIKILQELQIKREQLQEYRNQISESVLKQHELEHNLENEKRKNANDEFNNILMKNGNDALENERQLLSRELAGFKSRNDMIAAERDGLYAEARIQTLSNLKLKETIKDLERKHQCHLLFQNEIKEKLEKTICALKTVTPSIIKLQQKQENILEMFEDLSRFDNLRLSLKQIETLKNEAEKERDIFEKKFIAENVECIRLRELLENLLEKKINEDNKLSSFWKDKAIYLQSKLNEEKEKNENMEKMLKIALENEFNSRKLNENSKKQMKNVEIQTHD